MLLPVLAALLLLSACTTFDAGPPPAPPAAVEDAPVIPAGIRPLTADQHHMLGG